MSSDEKHLEDLKQIRTMMERSSRFLSLSGLSGVFAGVYALAGAWLAHNYMNTMPQEYRHRYYDFSTSSLAQRYTEDSHLLDFYSFFILVAGSILALSLITGFIFTRRKALKAGLKVWDSTSKRMLINLCIPLATGGIFCLVLLYYDIWFLVASSTLIFYGLALLNASKYTLNDIRYLGISEIVLGLISCFFFTKGLLFWAIGFGVLHIVYGAVMWWKYERN